MIQPFIRPYYLTLLPRSFRVYIFAASSRPIFLLTHRQPTFYHLSSCYPSLILYINYVNSSTFTHSTMFLPVWVSLLLAFGAAAIPHEKRSTVDDQTIYAYGTGISGLPVLATSNGSDAF